MKERKGFYFSTRDLIIMAALAALGGVAGTYINALGDAFQATLGFAGTTQWAAGLHVLWLTLAVGLTGKQGAGTLTGVLKGAVELLSGNTHGLLVVLVDVVAGILVDLGVLPFRKKDALPAFCLAGGLASASNVFVFQLFAVLPADTLAYGAMLVVVGVALISGVLFAGLLGVGLLNALRRAGVVKDRAPVPMGGRIYLIFLLVAGLLTVGLTLYLRQALRGPATIHVGGAVAAPYDYPSEHGDIAQITAEATMRNTTTRYSGAPIRELIARAQPEESASLVLARAVDGYAFFISMKEVEHNEALLLACQGKGDGASCDVVGAENGKAWVRGVRSLTVIGASTIEVGGALDQPGPYDPNDWQFEMDSVRLDVGDGPAKLQGAPLGRVLKSMQPQPDATTVIAHTGEAPVELPLSKVLADDDVRLFTVIGEQEITFALARMDGTVLAPRVTRIEVR
jgi:energy-coupling factor transport system substrate-specific component